MKKIPFYFCVFLASFSFAQCSLEISDTTHINCYGDNSGAIDLNVLNAAKPYIINLSNGAVSTNGYSFSDLTAGIYQLILLDANSCSDTIEIKLKEPSLLTLNLKCVFNDLLAEVSGGVKPYMYYWRDLSNAIISNDSLVSFNPYQFYDFEVVDNKGCKLRDSVSLVVDFSVDKIIGDVPLSIQLTNTSSEGLYQWNFDDGETSSDKNPIHEYESVGSYKLSLQLTDEHECVDEKTIVIEVQGFDLSINNWEEMFNAFSPNGDGINDSFSFEENNAISEFSVKIFNRWGSLVYSWTDPNFKWNGLSFDGDNLTQGVYYYYMNATGKDGQLYEKKGSISLFF
ncbi:MAG: gliding motility-associated C-terminal domain-containing protein [Bacteroidota bacterium]|nr:gliding motility-associated C-terminal domain-containing protein [Bacteroidota bacterium]